MTTTATDTAFDHSMLVGLGHVPTGLGQDGLPAAGDDGSGDGSDNLAPGDATGFPNPIDPDSGTTGGGTSSGGGGGGGSSTGGGGGGSSSSTSTTPGSISSALSSLSTGNTPLILGAIAVVGGIAGIAYLAHRKHMQGGGAKGARSRSSHSRSHARRR
jgi:hypothetical protein